MATNEEVNGKITDAVSQTAVGVLAEAPAVAIGALYQSLANANGLALWHREFQPTRHRRPPTTSAAAAARPRPRRSRST